MIKIKAGVKLKGIMPEIVLAIDVVNSIYEANGVTETWVTSGLDGTHMKDSPHHLGRAVDIRTHDVPRDKLATVQLAIQEALGPEFTLLLEDKDGPNEHAHIQSCRNSSDCPKPYVTTSS